MLRQGLNFRIEGGVAKHLDGKVLRMYRFVLPHKNKGRAITFRRVLGSDNGGS